MIDFTKLSEKFPGTHIHWRVARESSKGDKVQVLAYLENRDVMKRLDDVCGPENWKNEYTTSPNGGILCGISIKCGDEWVTKWDGAENTNVEAVKGGLADSMKRAAVQWGSGRYLYYLPMTYVPLADRGQNFHKSKSGQIKYWDTPFLPAEFLPQS